MASSSRIREPGRSRRFAAFVSVPWLLKPTGLDTSTAELEEALGLGATGLFLDHRVFGIAGPAITLASFKAMLHQPASVCVR